MRILAITHLFPHVSDPQQGVFAARQFAGFRRHGADVVVFYPVIKIPRFLGLWKRKWRDYNETHAPIDEYGLNVIRIPWVRLTRGAGSCRWDGLMVYRSMLRRACLLHREAPFDIIYGRGLFPGADAAARLSGTLRIPSVGVAIGGDINVIPRHSKIMARHCLRVLRSVDGLLANGEGLAEWIRGATGRECGTAHGVVDLSVFRPSEDKDELRRELGLPPNRTLLLYVGNLIREKGLYELIEAFERIRCDCEDAMLVMCGRGTEVQALKALVHRRALAGDVCLPGQVAPTVIHQWMQASDVFVFPSYQEGMPNAVMEAMACGLPVISTTVGGLPGAIGDSDGALLIAPREVEPLALAIKRLCMNHPLRRQMSLGARKTAVAKFGIDNNALSVINYLRCVREKAIECPERKRVPL